ncbi:hypothetical protein [Spiroplasma endosymbiont of Amphibalanus improvisus]|uniref:hypothetical protein n=1 Tax=Spiroplasma endosymbiont of Amphibalanus improvisus TaxID=3066327 RepID=UPI00313B1F4B
MYSNDNNNFKSVREVKVVTDNKNDAKLQEIVNKLSKKIKDPKLVVILKELTNLRLSTATIEKLINFKNEVSIEQKEVLKNINRLIGHSTNFDDSFTNKAKELIEQLNSAKALGFNKFNKEPNVIYEPKNINQLDNKTVFKDENNKTDVIQVQDLTDDRYVKKIKKTDKPLTQSTKTDSDPKIVNFKNKQKIKDFNSKNHHRFRNGFGLDNFKKWNKKNK